MNIEHTNPPRQAANAAFEQWWQRHGLEDPMDDEDRYYITASSWARRGYLAAMGLATIKDSLTVAQQAALIENLKVLAKSFGHKVGCAKNAFGEQCTCGVDEAIAAAEPATLCASCARANVDCPIYPQQTTSCIEHRDQQQAEPVALRSVFDQMFDYFVDPTDDVSREWLWRFSKGLIDRLAAAPQAAVPAPDEEECLHDFVFFRSECVKCGLPYAAAQKGGAA